ncbi:MAG TPA: hypothetical protein VLB85_04575 [Acidimicrobiia bacterium]|nr:hypothetical protein [Acidimicrobiia bacterium]
MRHEPHLGAVFAHRVGAEAAVKDLRERGLGSEHLGLAVHGPDTVVFEEDLEHEVGTGIEHGVAVGAPVGAIAGITLLSVASALFPGLSLGGLLAAGAVTGGLAGGFWGAYLGLTSEQPELEREADWERVPLDPGEVLVVVCEHGDPDDVREVIERHGGRWVEKPASIS